MKVNIELNITDDVIYLNYWDWKHGDDVIGKIQKDGSIILKEDGAISKINMFEFVELVKSKLQ